MKTPKKLTEELNRGRTLMGLKPLNSKNTLSEQIGSNNNTYHEWFDCSNAVFLGSGIRYWDRFSIDAAIAQYGQGVAGANGSSPVSSYGWYMGAPSPYNSASQNPNNGSLQNYATHQNSEAFWLGMGSPSPGTTLKYTSGSQGPNPQDYCLEYVGPVSVPSTGQHMMMMGTDSITNIQGPYGDCQMCQLGVMAPTYDCVNGSCIDPGDGSGQFSGANAYTDCNNTCGVGNPQEFYRCHDCTTPCSQTVVDAGHCPYTTTQDCQDQCAESNKWTCGMPDKFGNPRCVRCREYQLWDGTTCYPTKQMCLDSDCPGKLPLDKEMMKDRDMSMSNNSSLSKEKEPFTDVRDREEEVEKIRIKESDITNLVRKLIKERELDKGSSMESQLKSGGRIDIKSDQVDIEMSDGEVNDIDPSAESSEKLEKYEECGGGDSSLMCGEESCSFTLSITQFDANSVSMEAQLCGQGTIKFYKDGVHKMTSIGTCPNYTRSVGLLGLYIQSNPASPYYKTTYYFNAVLECLNGQVYEQTVCVGPDMQVKPCPASPDQPMPNNSVAESYQSFLKEEEEDYDMDMEELVGEDEGSPVFMVTKGDGREYTVDETHKEFDEIYGIAKSSKPVPSRPLIPSGKQSWCCKGGNGGCCSWKASHSEDNWVIKWKACCSSSWSGFCCNFQ
tara:strand:- start:1462 stop:3468 length:2007 start_codon:yes stop_codon:yes gene_type:complete